MLPVRVSTFVTALLALLINAFAQDPDKKMLLIGNIYDMDSLEQLSYVAIHINGNRQYVSDNSGHFEIMISVSDTIDFLYPGYVTSRILMGTEKITEDTLFIEVLMNLKVHDMQEANILPYKNYEEFRSALIHHENDVEADIAKRNMSTIMIQNKVNIGPAMDAYSNYRYVMKMKDLNNNAFIFLTSEPGKGIFGALNTIGIRLPWQRQ